MTRSNPFTFLAGAAVVPLVALAVAGCGGGDDSSNATAAVTPPKTASGRTATVGVANSGPGKILVDSAPVSAPATGRRCGRTASRRSAAD
jgi:hypothetical protein